ncbi:hypothetical protein BZA70DRAFT_267261 [Myxozyma melibiosi]|uniref:Uncharacterized protein n=1 Tax=Myxozyma melibiosi TaxID=54550 RepID=A0ABR1F6E9_9ASCO
MYGGISAQEEHIAVLEQQLSRLKDEVSSLERDRNIGIQENERLYNQIESLEKDNEQRGKDADRWRYRFVTEKQETETAKQQIESLQHAVKNRDQSNRELASSKIQLLSEVEALKSRLKELGEETRALSQNNSELLEQLQGYEDYTNELLDEIKALQNQQSSHDSDRDASSEDGDRQVQLADSIPARRLSDSAPNRRLSDELSAELVDQDSQGDINDEDDRSGQTLINDMDDVLFGFELDGASPGHSDIRSAFEKLKKSSGYESIRQWSTPEELNQVLTEFKTVVASVNMQLPNGKVASLDGEVLTEKLGSLQTAVAALAKQQFLIRQLLDDGDKVSQSVVVSENAMASENVKEMDVKKAEAKESSSVVSSGFLSESELERVSRIPGFKLAVYLVPAPMLESFKSESREMRVLIQLYFYVVAVLGLALAVGMVVGYGVSRVLTSGGECCYSSGPWWVGSRTPFVEKAMYRLEEWYLDRYGR